MLCGIYSTAERRANLYKEGEANCQLCGAESESLEHILLVCPMLEEVRRNPLCQIHQILAGLELESLLDDPTWRLQLILDCSGMGIPAQEAISIEQASQLLCAAVHNRRELMLDMS